MVNSPDNNPLWKSLTEVTEAMSKMSEETLTNLQEGVQSVAVSATENVNSLLQKTQETGESLIKTATEGIETGQQVVQKTVEEVRQIVDPAVVGGAFVGMSAGEVVGGAVGGVVGSFVGPQGTIVGVQLGAFAGRYIGLKIGSDLAQDIINNQQLNLNRPPLEQVEALAHFVHRKTGETIGETVGFAGGALVGSIIAGPVGGVVGGMLCGALVSQIGEDTAEHLNRQTLSVTSTQPVMNPNPASVPDWLVNTTQTFVGETGTEIVGYAVGSMVAGPVGGNIGQKLGIITGKKIDWRSLTPPTDKPVDFQESPVVETQEDKAE